MLSDHIVEKFPKGEEGGGQTTPFLHSVLVEGKYPPTPEELAELIDKVDLVDKFKNVHLSEQQVEGWLVVSFPSVEESHLFVLAIIAKLNSGNLCRYSPSDEFYLKKLLDDFRVNTGQLSYTEKQVVASKIEGTLQYKYARGEDKKTVERTNEAIKNVFVETMPHLAEQIKNFSFI